MAGNPKPFWNNGRVSLSSGATVLNPPFDPRMQYVGFNPNNSKGTGLGDAASNEFNSSAPRLTRGYVIADTGQGQSLKFGEGSGQSPLDTLDQKFGSSTNGYDANIGVTLPNGTRPAVAFLFNPVEWTESYSANTSIPNNYNNKSVASTISDSALDGAAITGMGFGNISITVPYDRTYELNTGDSSNVASVIGAKADVAAWQVLLGIISPENSETLALAGAGNVSATPQWGAGDAPNNPMLFGTYRLVLGPNLWYFGFISDFSVRYLLFTPQMVPMRAEVTFTMTLMNGGKGDATTGTVTTPLLNVSGTPSSPIPLQQAGLAVLAGQTVSSQAGYGNDPAGSGLAGLLGLDGAPPDTSAPASSPMNPTPEPSKPSSSMWDPTNWGM